MRSWLFFICGVLYSYNVWWQLYLNPFWRPWMRHMRDYVNSEGEGKKWINRYGLGKRYWY